MQKMGSLIEVNYLEIPQKKINKNNKIIKNKIILMIKDNIKIKKNNRNMTWILMRILYRKKKIFQYHHFCKKKNF